MQEVCNLKHSRLLFSKAGDHKFVRHQVDISRSVDLFRAKMNMINRQTLRTNTE